VEINIRIKKIHEVSNKGDFGYVQRVTETFGYRKIDRMFSVSFECRGAELKIRTEVFRKILVSLGSFGWYQVVSAVVVCS
jgi:hypothetical protein